MSLVAVQIGFLTFLKLPFGFSFFSLLLFQSFFVAVVFVFISFKGQEKITRGFNDDSDNDKDRFQSISDSETIGAAKRLLYTYFYMNNY